MAINVNYQTSGYCKNKHKKRKKGKLAICEINGDKYCFDCACQLLALHNISRRELKKQRHIKKQSKRKNKRHKHKRKQQKTVSQQWIEKIKKTWQDTPEQQKIRLSPEYKQWRISVLERDNYTCQHCKQTGGNLHCHHIKSFKYYPELRFDINNGATLCSVCHEQLHLSRYKNPKIISMMSSK